ncbi:sulfur oxidation c-type cytochrome SoxX [Inhella proteolytica]|uniref:Sulfur oxidation c-type cytochrome SoxX n=1 Tax=Inhella proteolytica TaxID=2795029 RepID=A0A931NEW2_9BURK|nr:sulfur oxidation c-type cytochrome SoxX [Inhella proteolytica]MBH9578132.1 sulfur oxidation c-type cytochrome SoxX [Inhella proteolytica]
MKTSILFASAGAVLLAACASLPSPAELDSQAQAMMKASFRDQGIAKVDRLNQDLGQSACSSDKPPTDAVSKQVEKEAIATIQPPSDGRYLGDWKRGEALAQNGRGMTWTDTSIETKVNGGNCYNCHQIDKKEISFGTIGPSLWNYGKLRGVLNPDDPAAKPIVEYTWGKLWNSKAYSACSNMPRFGHAKLLDEGQLKDLMALLLDPKSPVNQ